MGGDVDLIEALRTTGAVREFRAEPVADEVLYRVLDAARFAPSGGNRQGWRLVLVKDAAVRRRLRDLYLPGWREYLAQRAAGLVPFAPVTDEEAERAAIASVDPHATGAPAAGSVGDFADHLDAVPVLLVLLADLRALAAVDKGLPRYTLVGGASIYPFAQNVLLAARAEGLAGVLTTMNVRREPEMRELLGVPPEQVVAGVIALGRPVHQPTRLSRARVESFTTVDRADGAPFTP
jgi:nitroreductase